VHGLSKEYCGFGSESGNEGSGSRILPSSSKNNTENLDFHGNEGSGSRILPSSSKNKTENLDFHCFVTFKKSFIFEK
jgi:hypothetical protein